MSGLGRRLQRAGEIIYDGPLVITTGGTYRGNFESTDSNTAAIIVDTTQPVILDRVQVRHGGVGIEQGISGVNLTVTNSSFTALPPTVTQSEQQAIRLYQPASLVVEHNHFADGHGVQINGENSTLNTLSISYNNYLDIGCLSQPDLYQGAIHFDKVTAPGGVIVWNRIVNHRGKSHAEDVIAMATTWGAPGNPIEIAHNMVNGAYPFSGDGAGYSGGAYDFADITGGYIDGHHNYAVNYTNNGFMIPTGTEVYHRFSVAVYDGIADDGQRVSSSFGDGFTTWNNPGYPLSGNIGVTDSRSGHRRWNGTSWERADYYLPTGANSGNTSIPVVDAAAKQNAIDEFEQSVIDNGVTIGPVS